MMSLSLILFFFNATATTEIYTLSLHDALPIFEAKMTQGDGTARDKVSRVIRLAEKRNRHEREGLPTFEVIAVLAVEDSGLDRKSTRLNSSHGYISYAVFCLKKKKNK